MASPIFVRWSRRKSPPTKTALITITINLSQDTMAPAMFRTPRKGVVTTFAELPKADDRCRLEHES